MNAIAAINRRKLLGAILVLGAARGSALFAGAANDHHDTATPGPGTATPQASPGATPQSGETVVVEMTQAAQFDPAELVIGVGTTVKWDNVSEMEHTATCDPEENPFKKTRPELISLPDDAEPWASELLKPGESYSHTFTVPGEYKYICFPHVLSGMVGIIRVEE